MPAELCLTLSYIECLLELAKTSELLSTNVLLYCADCLCKAMRRVDLASPIKVSFLREREREREREEVSVDLIW